MRPGDTVAVQLGGNRKPRGCALEVAQAAVMKVHDLRGDGARLRRRRRRLPDRPIELLDQVLIDPRAGRVRLEQRVAGGGAQPGRFRHRAANGSYCASTTRSFSVMIALSVIV